MSDTEVVSILVLLAGENKLTVNTEMLITDVE